MNNVVIAGFSRTPVGNFMGSLSSVSAVELGEVTALSAMERAGIQPEDINEVVAGMVCRAGSKGNPARQILLRSGIPSAATASTVDQQCASGMKALEMGSQQIMLGKVETSLALGIESMSQAPLLLMGARNGYKLGGTKAEDSLLHDALHDATLGYHMGVTAENLVEKYQISRDEQDELALLSHQRACKAIKEGKFKEEITPVEITTRKGTIVVDKDEHPRDNLSIDELKKLRPAFKKDGSVTAGNSSSINDGAAAVVLMNEQKAKEKGIKPLARVIATASVGVDPEIMGIGPAYAIPEVLRVSSMEMDQIDYFEINEAFASQFIAVNRELKIDMEKVNANGSGISIGHPVGCTGLRIIIALIQELKRRDGRYGIASLCVGGGPAMAAIIELL